MLQVTCLWSIISETSSRTEDTSFWAIANRYPMRTRSNKKRKPVMIYSFIIWKEFARMQWNQQIISTLNFKYVNVLTGFNRCKKVDQLSNLISWENDKNRIQYFIQYRNFRIEFWSVPFKTPEFMLKKVANIEQAYSNEA